VGKGTSKSIVPAQRHIIERPRLTKLLDESSAQVILLVAPAGYGKTTLARQWVADKPHVWYECRPESTDVAALATGIAQSLERHEGGVATRVANLLATYKAHRAELLIARLTKVIGRWPSGTPPVIDDAHLIAQSPAEAFVGSLGDELGVRIVVATRLKPTWATARRRLYGAIAEIHQTDLAMTDDEVKVELRDQEPIVVSSIVNLASGWPALIGLASFAHRRFEATNPPEELHEYFADELFAALPATAQDGLVALSLAPEVTREVAGALLLEDAGKVIAAGVEHGFLSPRSASRWEMHPLLRTFLRSRAQPSLAESAARTLASHLS
jgi:LuxR family transcriptional regulator, maltose regulon positive regulatory protein